MHESFDEQVWRNLQGAKYEKQGLVDNAIILYEKNVDEFFEGSHPYKRLAIIYHKQKNYEDERRVLEQAIYVFENIVYEKRADREKKLQYFKERLAKLNSMLNK